MASNGDGDEELFVFFTAFITSSRLISPQSKETVGGLADGIQAGLEK